MSKRNISFVIVGLVAGKSQTPPKDIKEWLMTLSKEQREQFDGVIKRHLDRYQVSKEKSADEPGKIFEDIREDLKKVLTPDQFAAFQSISQKKPEPEDQMGVDVKRCLPCVNARGYLSSADYDLNKAQPLFKDEYCIDPSWHPPMHPVDDAIHWAIIFTQMAIYKSPTSYYNCRCDNATKALEYVQKAIKAVDIAVRQTGKYQCNPTPWLYPLGNARNHLIDAQTKIQKCKDISCN